MDKAIWSGRVIDSISIGSPEQKATFANSIFSTVQSVYLLAVRAQNEKANLAKLKSQVARTREQANEVSKALKILGLKRHDIEKRCRIRLPEESLIRTFGDVTFYLETFDRLIERMAPVADGSRTMGQQVIADMVAGLYLQHLGEMPRSNKSYEATDTNPTDFDRVCGVICDILQNLNLLGEIGVINYSAKRNAISKLHGLSQKEKDNFTYRTSTDLFLANLVSTPVKDNKVQKN